MSVNPKKVVVGIGATICSIISAVLWIWFSNIPAFQDSTKTWSEINSTFENVTREDLK